MSQTQQEYIVRVEGTFDSYGLGTEVAPGRGDSHRTACLEALALFEAPGVRAT